MGGRKGKADRHAHIDLLDSQAVSTSRQKVKNISGPMEKEREHVEGITESYGRMLCKHERRDMQSMLCVFSDALQRKHAVSNMSPKERQRLKRLKL